MSAHADAPTHTVAVGDLELTSITDAVGLLGELDELFPGTTVSEWEPYRALYPELFTGSKMRILVTCFLVRAPGGLVLVDTGVGPPGRWGWEAETEGALPSGLRRLGVDPADVETVLLTHLHVDHVGWLADEELFPRARYFVHADALAFALEHSPLAWLRERLSALTAADRVVMVADGSELGPGVVVEELPGHYPGHLGLRLESAGRTALIAADAAVQPAMLDDPGRRYVSDDDHVTAVATRRALVARLVDTETLVACGHYDGSGIGRIVRRDASIVWEEAL